MTNPPNEPTPETDAEVQRLLKESIPEADGPNMATFARQLERRAIELREDKAILDWLENPESCYHICIARQPDGFSILNTHPEKGEVRQAVRKEIRAARKDHE